MQSLEVIQETNFVGMNDRLPSHVLPRGVFQLIENALVFDNKIVKRSGTSGSTSLGAFSHNGGLAFEPNGASKMIIVSRNGASNAQLYKSTDGTTYAAIGVANLTLNLTTNLVQCANRLFGFNGTEVVDVASDGTTVTKNRAGVPLGKFGFWFHNFLFVGGVTANPNRLYFSNLGDPTTFSAGDYIDINANDGDMLTGLSALNDELLIFKNYAVWTITGYSSATFTTDITRGQSTNSRVVGLGTPSHQSIVSAGGKVYYLSFLGGVPHIRVISQTMFGKIVDGGIYSLDMETTLLGLNLTQLSKVCGVYDGKYLYWAFPNGSSTTNNLVLVHYPQLEMRTAQFGVIRSWVKWTGIAPQQFFMSTISGRSKIYFTDPTTTGKVFVFDSSVYTDNGVAIAMDVRSRDYQLDPAKKAKWKYMYHRHKTGSAGTLNMNARIDRAAVFANQDMMALTGNSPGLGPTGTFTLGTSVLGGGELFEHRVTFAHLIGHLLGVQFTESTANSCELYDFNIYGYKKGLRNG